MLIAALRCQEISLLWHIQQKSSNAYTWRESSVRTPVFLHMSHAQFPLSLGSTFSFSHFIQSQPDTLTLSQSPVIFQTLKRSLYLPPPPPLHPLHPISSGCLISLQPSNHKTFIRRPIFMLYSSSSRVWMGGGSPSHPEPLIYCAAISSDWQWWKCNTRVNVLIWQDSKVREHLSFRCVCDVKQDTPEKLIRMAELDKWMIKWVKQISTDVSLQNTHRRNSLSLFEKHK